MEFFSNRNVWSYKVGTNVMQLYTGSSACPIQSRGEINTIC